jgi:hypothetical protein
LRAAWSLNRRAKGFIIHTNGSVPGGWRVVEVWQSQADFEAWFEASVKPAFPEGGPMPSIAFEELNEVVTCSGAGGVPPGGDTKPRWALSSRKKVGAEN